MNKEVRKYYSNTPIQSQAHLESLRRIISSLVPSSSEEIRYGIPTFVIDDKSVVGIGGWRNFVSLYPYGSSLITKLKDDLKDLKTTKGAIQFGLDKPLPKEIIKKIVINRLRDINTK